MPKASEVAAELRRVAEALDREPETVIERGMLSFYCNQYSAEDKGKKVFLDLVRLLPKPLQKEADKNDYTVYLGKNGPLWVRAKIARMTMCTLVSPAVEAVYDCVPLLSLEEEASLTSAD